MQDEGSLGKTTSNKFKFYEGQDSPGLFFAYNNGIAATGSDVTVVSNGGQLLITGLTDLQIVNGGQTTASILSARRKDRLSLDGVSVQMKLTRVLPAQAQDLIPSIAEYANTQNKIAAADFFANHPFHRKMEEISRRMLTPPKAGHRIQSKWFYERSRGQYQNERLYLTKAVQAAFETQYPPKQLISKTDLAKFAHTLDGKPYWVSLGAQKNFSKFASGFSSRTNEVSEAEHWEKLSPEYGDGYFRAMVAVALIWKQMEGIVDAGKGSWYEGGYRINIVTYTVAKLFHDIRKTGGEVDLERIWNAQASGPDILAWLELAAPLVQQSLLLTPPGVRNIGEWLKRDECWQSIAALKIQAPDNLERIAMSKSDYAAKKTDSRKQGQMDDSIGLQGKLLELTNSGYWAALHAWSTKKSNLAPSDLELVSRARTPQGFLKTQPKDHKKLTIISKAAEDDGFRHPAR